MVVKNAMEWRSNGFSGPILDGRPKQVSHDSGGCGAVDLGLEKKTANNFKLIQCPLSIGGGDPELEVLGTYHRGKAT